MKLDRAIARMEQAAALYASIDIYCEGTGVVDLQGTDFFSKAIELLGPCLPVHKTRVDLETIFQVAFHGKSRALIVANKGVTFASLSPFTSISYITRHIACSVYHPDLGVETVNIGLSGNVYQGQVVVRAESACPPSFLFGSQRCNCCYQWSSLRELAAHFNPIQLPEGLKDEDLEKWVSTQFSYKNGRHLPMQDGRGMIMMHLDSQSGMGSGLTEGEFVWDLYNRALMRQLAENTTEQTYHTSIKEGYEAIGLQADARRQNKEVGYQIPAILLDWLGCSPTLVVLSNNQFKLRQFEMHGFEVQRVKSLGKISLAGQREARQRGEDFHHLDMDGQELSFDEEMERLKHELTIA